jgi:hypothetical protein
MSARIKSARGRLLRVNPFLHRSDAERVAHLGSYVGMAFFANSGPLDRNCGHCEFWDGLPTAAKARCGMFRKLTGTQGALVPRHAGACRYFERKEEKNR